ncbi:MAG: hypothetical protein AB1480_17645 [Nitrospirota bacterium]
MLKYLEAIEELPKELKVPLLRVLELFREDMAETVKKSDFERFEKTTEENFNRVWKSIEELAEAQKKTEIRVEELAEAQKKTEEELVSLTRAVKNMQKEMGGLSNTIGYELEDSLYPLLPKVLKEDFGAEIEGDLERTFIEYDGREDEVNIYGKGRIDGKRVYIIGESKAQIGKADAEVFIKMVKRLSRHLKEQTLPILVCYSVHPKVETYIKEHYPDIKLYKTFQVKRRAK